MGRILMEKGEARDKRPHLQHMFRDGHLGCMSWCGHSGNR